VSPEQYSFPILAEGTNASNPIIYEPTAAELGDQYLYSLTWTKAPISLEVAITDGKQVRMHSKPLTGLSPTAGSIHHIPERSDNTMEVDQLPSKEGGAVIV
jgi:hypothetical protein